MGIQGLWEELSPASDKIALIKLAHESFQKDRPLRLAIDTSIWSFQVQGGQAGTNPALRTFYYRLCRLLLSNVLPVFVFDGPDKPPFKRNQRTSTCFHEHEETKQMKALIKAFGFTFWDAPGEAEAECALLEREGLVDIVITEDVDSLMFGASKVAREIPDKNRTHVNLYSDVERKTGLDSDGLVFIAMASGGDYLPAGIPNCGPKGAAEIARAGYGTSLLETTDHKDWREKLADAIESNPDKIFSRKRPRLAKQIRESNFPDTEILKYYTDPAISSKDRLKTFKLEWRKPDAKVAAKLCQQLFEWTTKWGMARFLRSFTPGYLTWHILHEYPSASADNSAIAEGTEKPKLKLPAKDKVEGKKITDFFKSTKIVSSSVEKPPTPPEPKVASDTNEKQIILNIHGTRKHSSTDSVEELRLSYIPSTILPYTSLGFDLRHYPDPPSESTPVSPSKRRTEDRTPSSSSQEDDEEEKETTKRREWKWWSPDEIKRIWISSAYVRRYNPEMVLSWGKKQAERKSAKKSKAMPKKNKGKENNKERRVSAGTMDQFVRKSSPSRRMGTPSRKSIPKAVGSEHRGESLLKKSVVSKGSTAGRKTSPAKTSSKGTASTIVKETGTEQFALAKSTSKVSIFRSPPSTPPRLSKVVTSTDKTPIIKGCARQVSITSISSGSDSLPSPSNLLAFLTPKSIRKDKPKSVVVDDLGSPVASPLKDKETKRIVGSFRESLGGTLHELE